MKIQLRCLYFSSSSSLCELIDDEDYRFIWIPACGFVSYWSKLPRSTKLVPVYHWHVLKFVTIYIYIKYFFWFKSGVRATFHAILLRSLSHIRCCLIMLLQPLGSTGDLTVDPKTEPRMVTAGPSLLGFDLLPWATATCIYISYTFIGFDLLPWAHFCHSRERPTPVRKYLLFCGEMWLKHTLCHCLIKVI